MVTFMAWVLFIVFVLPVLVSIIGSLLYGVVVFWKEVLCILGVMILSVSLIIGFIMFFNHIGWIWLALPVIPFGIFVEIQEARERKGQKAEPEEETREERIARIKRSTPWNIGREL